MADSDPSSGMTMIWRDEPSYPEALDNLLWNQRKPGRSPDVIVSPANVQDVVDAINLARSRGMKVTAQSGGHTWCGTSLRDGGMVMELSQLTDFSIDEQARTATVQPYVKSHDIALTLAKQGLAFPTGHCAHTSVAGFLLSGGWGWNARVWGPSCASVEEIEVVTADGSVVTASEQENPDLFWAARGAGSGFFGIVTRFRLRLQTLPQAITSSTYRYPLAYIDQIAAWASEISPALHPAVEMLVWMNTAAPEVASTPGQKIITVEGIAFADAPEQAQEWLAVMETCPVLEHALTREVNTPSSWDALYDDTDEMWPEHRRSAVETLWCDGDFTTTLPKLAAHIVSAPSPETMIIAWLDPVPRDLLPLPDMAFSMFARQLVAYYTVWQDPADDAANIAWLGESFAAAEPLGFGHYIGESELLAAPTRVERSYGESQWLRLAELRDRFDPDGLFHNYLGAGC